MIHNLYEPGDLLIAPPTIRDSRFAKSVIIIAHEGEGTMGFCLNRPTELDLASLMPGRDILDAPQIYWGGPVNPTTIWMLHDCTWHRHESHSIDLSWSVTSHMRMFDDFSPDRRPQRYRIFSGVSSWAPGQLISELEGEPPWHRDHSWLILRQPDPSWLWNTAAEDLWITATTLSGQQAVAQWLP